ncbi:MAG: carbohydrate binding family 9 domain-containing protein [Rhodothermales bacterium]|nr:carbohydrate binding family 9 domain-containing protein [Rhodothermales bacterium]
MHFARFGRLKAAAVVPVLIAFFSAGGAAAQTSSEALSSPPDIEIPIGANNSIRAVYAATAPRIDGVLDDEIWSQTPAADQFVQLAPTEGVPPSDPSAIRIAYDENNLYFGLSFYDSNPDQIRARNLERGGPNGRDDMFWLLIDTYHDGRNAYLFETNVLGTQDDAIISDESMSHNDWQWDGIYESEGRIADDGWHVELAIPFRTIRFDNAESPTMGIAIMRFVSRSGERSMWPFIPRRYSAGIFQVSQYATMHGLQDIERGRNILIKPYVITGGQEVRVGEDAGEPVYESDFKRDAGLDVKYGITPNLTLDVTINTDFAQVESDAVQLDLTRFNLFFPEKREFFLERAGLFQFGQSGQTETFFSRRIGISNDIIAGGRLVGQFDKLSVGALNIQTLKNDELDLPGANNSVVRVRADVLPRTTVGGIVTNLEQGDRYNRALGADASRRFWGNSEIQGWYTRVQDSDPDLNDGAGRVSLNLRRADYGFSTAYANIGENFSPALGFVRRRDVKNYSVSANYSPQIGSGFFRAYSVNAYAGLVNGQDNEKQSSDVGGRAWLRFLANDRVSLEFNRNFERLERPFEIRPDAVIETGDYVSDEWEAGFRTSDNRFLTGHGEIRLAEFFGGDRTTYSGGLGVRTGKYLQVDAGIRHDVFDLPIDNGSFDATVFSMNINMAKSRKLFAKSLIQYDNFSGNLQANIRIDWIHSPGADLFIVFNTNYNLSGDVDRFDPRTTLLNNRVGVAKLTYVIQM